MSDEEGRERKRWEGGGICLSLVYIFSDNKITYCSSILFLPILRRCPKTVENFCVHSLNGYYNNHVFHRVIKSFMIQTGDPTGQSTSLCCVAHCALVWSCVLSQNSLKSYASTLYLILEMVIVYTFSRLFRKWQIAHT